MISTKLLRNIHEFRCNRSICVSALLIIVSLSGNCVHARSVIGNSKARAPVLLANTPESCFNSALACHELQSVGSCSYPPFRITIDEGGKVDVKVNDDAL